MEETKLPPLPPPDEDSRIPWKPANAVQRCERSGGHVVRVKNWPLVRKGSDGLNEPPSEATTCERCDASVIVYNDTTPGVRVVKPSTLEVASSKK